MSNMRVRHAPRVANEYKLKMKTRNQMFKDVDLLNNGFTFISAYHLQQYCTSVPRFKIKIRTIKTAQNTGTEKTESISTIVQYNPSDDTTEEGRYSPVRTTPIHIDIKTRYGGSTTKASLTKGDTLLV